MAYFIIIMDTMATNQAEETLGGLREEQTPGHVTNQNVVNPEVRRQLTRAGRRTWYNPAMENVVVNIQVGGLLSDHEISILERHFEKYNLNEFYPAFAAYIIRTDARHTPHVSDKVILSTGEYYWTDIITEAEAELDKERFIVRRFAATKWYEIFDLWMRLNYFKEMRENGTCPYAGHGIDGVDMIYLASFMTNHVPRRLKTKVAQYHRSRLIKSDAEYIGIVDAFGVKDVETIAPARNESVTHNLMGE